ncbi:MAG: LPS biosynthesis protein WbpP, partial [Pyrinomonadaceae bacterium]
AGVGHVINVANGERVSLNRLLEVIKRITGQTDAAADHQPERKGDVKHSQADNSRAIEWLGYRQHVGLEDGLKKTIDWWKSSRFAK